MGFKGNNYNFDRRRNNSKGVNNAEHSLFRRLTRLFSGPLIKKGQDFQDKYKRRDLDKFKFTSASGKSFKRSDNTPYEVVQLNKINSQHRMERYVDYDQMEFEPILYSALDIYADEMTTSSDLEPLMRIKCDNKQIKDILEHLFSDILNVEANLYGWARSMCKYGDYFLYLDIDDKLGITNVLGLPSHEIERLEGEDKTNPNYIQYQWNSGGLTFENWQIAHFRILGNDKHAPYGTSVLDGARRIWRQLVLIEDAMMAYRIVRSPERRVFYIDVGGIPPNEVEQHMQQVITQMKRHTLVDSNTGKVDLRFNPASIEEDYYIPIRGDKSSRIESLPGGQYTGDIDDVNYLKDKLFSAIKIPQSYLSSSDNNEDKTTLAQKDIRFSRTIQRLQRPVLSEMEKIAMIHLYTLGFRGDDLLGFELKLNNPSRTSELQQLEHWRTKFDIAAAATEGFFSKSWVSKNIFGMSEEEFLQNQRGLYYDRSYENDLEQSVTEVEGGDFGEESPFEGLGSNSDVGSAGGGFFDEDDTLGGGAPPPEAEDDGVLLAQPENSGEDAGLGEISEDANDGDSYLTPGSKGKRYTKEVSDGRKSVGTGKEMRGSYNDEIRGRAKGRLFKGKSELDSLGRINRNDFLGSISLSENKILGRQRKLNILIESLEKK